MSLGARRDVTASWRADYCLGVEAAPVIRLPVAFAASDHALADLVSAFELVASGQGRRFVLAGIPGVEGIAAEALAYAQAAHVAFRLERTPRTPRTPPAAIVGPVEA